MKCNAKFETNAYDKEKEEVSEVKEEEASEDHVRSRISKWIPPHLFTPCAYVFLR